MKSNYYVQCFGKDVSFEELEKIAKEKWKEEGYFVKDIKTLDIYFKPEENTCYYVFNNELTGSFELS